MHKFLDFTNIKGFWFWDFGPAFSHFFFDIFDLDDYPPEIYSCVEHNQHYLSYYSYMHVRARRFHDFFPVELEYTSENLVHNMVQSLRELVASRYHINPHVLPEAYLPDDYKYEYYGELDPEVKEKRYFFLDMARRVVNDEESFSTVTKKYKIDRTNLSIWISILLAYGPVAFVKAPEFFPREREEDLVRDHFKLFDGVAPSVVQTCTRYLVFNRNTFRNILRRHPRP